MIIGCLSAFVATAALSIVFHAPRKYMGYTGIAGALGWGIYLALTEHSAGKTIATLIATLCVALFSHLLARKRKAPVTMFLIPGVIPLVPGAGMYRIVASVIANDKNGTTYYMMETLQLAGAIALGIFIIDTLLRRENNSRSNKIE